MKRFVLAVAIAACAIAPMVTHAQQGWKIRADRSTDVRDPDAPGDIKFMAMGGGFHAVNPSAAVYWNPANSPTGNYTLKGTFKLMKPSGHSNYYGLVLGGSNLETATQSYTYFLVSQTGEWLIKKRDGDTTTTPINNKTASEAVAKPGADGTSTNTLEVRVDANNVNFVVNGTIVHTRPKSEIKTDGIAGIRVNHQLEVMITGFAVTK